jgi:Na+-driven multidrug efflux pump
MIAVQIALGVLMTVIFVSASENLAAAFVPEQVRQSSLTYVRISSVEALSSAMETVVSSCTRALDHPDVPLLISSTKFVINIMLDLLVISKFHVGSFIPTVNTQALIRLACDLTSAFSGLFYFIYIALQLQRQSPSAGQSVKPGLKAFRILARPSVYTFTESAIRNALYLWLVSRIILLGENYATAWGIFNTIRWGLVMVPVQALEASTLTFVGHNWGQWRARIGVEIRRPKATKADLLGGAPLPICPSVRANVLLQKSSAPR